MSWRYRMSWLALAAVLTVLVALEPVRRETEAARLAQGATATLVPALPNLIFRDLRLDYTPGLVCAGGLELGVLVSFENVGEAPAPAFLVTAGDRWLATGPLGPRRRGQVWFRGLVPDPGAPLRVILDEGEQVAEADESDNLRSVVLERPPVPSWPTCTPTPVPTGPLPTATPRPDLVAQNMFIRLDPNWSCGMTPWLGVRGRFTNERGPFTGPFVVTANETPRASEGLPAGRGGWIWVPGYVASDENVLVVDAAGQVDEVDEENNRRAERVPIPTLPPCPSATPTADPPVLPDLVLSEYRWAHQGFNGACIPPWSSGVELSMAVHNQGAGPAGSFLVRLEPDGIAWRVGRLAADGRAGLAPLSPSSLSMTFPHVVTVDAEDEVEEAREDNNVRSFTAPPTMTRPPYCTVTPTPSPTSTSGASDTPTPADQWTPTPTATAEELHGAAFLPRLMRMAP